MNLDQVDFTALQQMQNVWGLAWKQLLHSKSSSRYWFIVSLIAPFIFLFLLPGIGLVFFGIPFYMVYMRAALIKRQSWQQFATANDWSINNPDTYAVPQGLQNFGHDRRTSQVITALFSGVTCDLLTYEYTVGEGKYQHTNYFTIARTHLAKQFPHIILDSKKNHGGFRHIPPDYENLKLEGDFDNYFKLYEAKGEEVDVLSIITPDIMQTLLDNDQQQDIEIWDNYLYFVGISDERVPAAMRSLLQSVQKLSAEIIHRAYSLEYTPSPSD